MFPYCVEIGELDSNPCTESVDGKPSINSTQYQLWKTSCLARDYSIILALNLCETRPCDTKTDPDCPSDSRYQWNTEIVFNETGALVAKYHKTHLFGGSAVFDQAVSVPTSFTSSFGVTFGLFICFDILYAHPAVDLVQAGITDFIFSSWWVNPTPTIDAIMQQQAWSRLHQVNLIASNTGAGPGKSGGGIYASGEVLGVLFDNQSLDVNQMIVATVPIKQSASRPAKFHPIELMSPAGRPHTVPLKPTPALTYQPCQPNPMFDGLANCTSFTSAALLEFAASSGLRTTGDLQIPVSMGGVSCYIEVLFDQVNSTDEYVAFAYEGVQTFPDTPDPLSLQICSLHHCVPTPGQEALECQPIFTPYESTSRLFSITATGFDQRASVFPIVSVEDGTLLPHTSNTVLHDQNQSSSHNNQDTRVLQWSTTNQFATQSLYSATLYGVRPNK